MRISTTIKATLAVMAISAGAAQAGSTPWLDRDNPSGKGDYEDTVNLLTIQCRIKGTKQNVDQGVPDAKYHKDPIKGCWCVNRPGDPCKDIEIRYKW